MNPAVILAMLSDFYAQGAQLNAEVERLTEENARLAAERDDLLHRADHAPDPTV